MKYHLKYLIINRGILLLRAWWKSGIQSRDPRTLGTSGIPWDTLGPYGTPKTASNLLDPLRPPEALGNPRIYLGAPIFLGM